MPVEEIGRGVDGSCVCPLGGELEGKTFTITRTFLRTYPTFHDGIQFVRTHLHQEAVDFEGIRRLGVGRL